MMEGLVGRSSAALREDFFCLFNGEVADGVEDPVERETEFVGGAQAGALEAGKDGIDAGRIGLRQ